MKPSKIDDMLDLAVKIREKDGIYNPLFVSPPGLGKTEIVQAWANKRGLRSITMTLSCYDPPDFKGFPHLEMRNGKQRMSFATPDFWPDDGHGIIILEELNRSPVSIMQCLLSLGDNRRGFDGYKLPKGWIIAGCINAEGGDCEVTTMDPALKDRFQMFDVGYDKRTFLDYAKSTSWHSDILNFVEANLWSYKTPEEIGNAPGAKYVSPRTWSKVNAVMQVGVTGEDELLVLETELGSNVSKEFYSFRHNETPVMMINLLDDLKGSLRKLERFSDVDNYKSGMVSLTVKSILEENVIEDATLIEVLKVIPVAQGTSLICDLELKRKDNSILQRLCKSSKELKNLYKYTLAQNAQV